MSKRSAPQIETVPEEAALHDTPIQVAEATLLGDIMKFVVDELKAAPDVWQKLSQHKQDEVIYRIDSRARQLVGQVVDIIASNDRPTIAATVESVTVKEGIKAVLTLSKTDEQRHELFDAAGRPVLLVVASKEEFLGGADRVKSDPDQKPLNGFGEMDDLENAA